ncbi:hypothetical protein MTO96_026413 [Rhipicephalus appendiculatus]
MAGHPLTARAAQSQQPQFRAPYQAPPRATAPPARGRGARKASNVPRPGILKKPSPKLEQQQHPQQLDPQPRAPLPSWSNAPQHGAAHKAGHVVQRPAFGNLHRSQPVAQLTPPRPPSGTTVREAAKEAQIIDETGDFRIPSYGVATAKGTSGVCEVFGMLNSAPTGSRQGLVKHFTLREGRSSVNCVFYQMDRPLGQLRKGTMLRCVGFMNRTGQLSVVSARPATDDENKLLDVLSTITAL